MKNKNVLITFIIAIALQACSTKHLDKQNFANKELPNTVEYSNVDQTFLWGGQILDIKNESNLTKLTILSFPLSRSEKPKVKKNSGGRFVAVYNGFLEPTDFRPGNNISVIGQLQTFESGNVSGAEYRFPVLNIQNLSLYKVDNSPSSGYRLPVNFGIGVGIGI